MFVVARAGDGLTSLDDLARSGSVPSDMADELRSLVQSRQAFVVSGGTGAGKTTLLSALLAEVSPDERTGHTLHQCPSLIPLHGRRSTAPHRQHTHPL